MDIIGYTIAQESLLSRLKETRASNESFRHIRDKILTMDPMDVAKRIVKVLIKFQNSDDGKKMDYVLAKDPDSKRQIEAMCGVYQRNPGKFKPETSTLVTISGYECILVTKADKKDAEEKFFQLVAPVTVKGKINQEIISPMTAARLFFNHDEKI